MNSVSERWVYSGWTPHIFYDREGECNAPPRLPKRALALVRLSQRNKA
jgi:hypothetical protein